MERTRGKTPSHSQPSIRSFFQPKQPNYAAPPSSTTTSIHTPPKSEEAITDSAIELQPTTKPPPAPIPPPLPTPPGSTSQQEQQRHTNLPLLPPPPSLHPQASIVPITADHIPALRRINSLLLQVTYPDSFYTAILTPSKSGLFSRAILWTEPQSTTPKVIGSLIIRPEEIPSSTTQQTLYIQSITLLSPYRSLGLAAAALDHVLSSAQLSSLSPDSGWAIRSVYAHVWTENEDGLRWYAARGFRRSGREPVKGYYHRLRPDTAWIVRRDLTPMAAEQARRADDGGIPRQNGTTAKESVLAGAVNLPGFTSSNGTTQSPPEQDRQNALPTPPPTRPNTVPSLSYQKTRPQTEWNDLPEDMVAGNAGAGGGGPPKAVQHLSAPVSGASSRSSSAARKKKERAYPAAAFGK